MAVEALDPPDLPKPYGWRQLAVGTGNRVVFLSGQTPRTADGEPVGMGDLAAQTEQVYLNVATGLKAAGATFDDVLRLTIYVVDWSLDKWEAITAGAERAAAKLGADVIRPTTLVGVATLAEPDFLIEIEATAIAA
ncbi:MULTISPECIES: RidA family protein [unclassified Streptomyces]|uniref:RidA family protein n=1 Tax=unclassified Streptomyces TaxID=2593676 RepID=UPI0013C17D3F|nr:RidA family protein [Streptomyces sp. SID10853]NDZ77188.1 RidA family protein [Streptomyces sp. SID10853]WSU42258.1 RidA family protein [Streptomyces sp. NBC_01089]